MDKEELRVKRRTVLSDISPVSSDVIRDYELELSDSEFKSRYASRTATLESAGLTEGTTGSFDTETLYLLCRALKPEMVVQTGTLHGASDAHILYALERNETGTLHSIDLPEQPSDYKHGFLIPDGLRTRWHLHLGDAKDILQGILQDVGPVDLFYHDSLHQYDHMIFEYETALEYLGGDGIIASHDVLKNSAFETFAQDNNLKYSTLGNVGISSKE